MNSKTTIPILLALLIAVADLANAQTKPLFASRDTSWLGAWAMMSETMSHKTTIWENGKEVAYITKDSILIVEDSIGAGRVILKLFKSQSEATNLWVSKYYAATKALSYIDKNGKMTEAQWKEFSRLVKLLMDLDKPIKK